MKKIAVLTDRFMTWNGGVDFIKLIILALSSVAPTQDIEVYVFIARPKSYKNYKGLVRLFIKLMDYFSSRYSIETHNQLFPEISRARFLVCNPKKSLKIMRKIGVDFFIPHLDPAYFRGGIRGVGYLYDCQHKYFPEFFSENAIKDRDRSFKQMLSSGGHLIVNAQSVKSDLIQFYGASPSVVHVLPFTPKVNPDYLSDRPELLIQYTLPSRFFLISNQFWMHKDHATAFHAFACLLRDSEFEDVELICTGLMEDERNPAHIDSLKALIVSLSLEKKIRCLGLIPKRDQIEIMKRSVAVVQPTLFEGGPGGGAVWDAVSLGVPVLMSDIPTNREISGDNIEFFKVRCSEDLALKMKQALNSSFVRQDPVELQKQSQERLQQLGEFLLKLQSSL